MAITRWNPTRDLMSTWNEFDRMFNRLTRSGAEERDSDISNVGTWRPALDITEREQEYLVTAELPGIAEDDVNISIKNNVLTIKGEKKHETEEKSDERYYSERVYGSFQRMIRLDSDIESDKVEADYENGVLNIRLPKTKDTMHKQIPVKFKK